MNIQASLKALPSSHTSREKNYKLVDEALKIIKESNLKFLIGPSETTVEGKRDDVMDLIKMIQDCYYENNIDFLLFVTFEYNKDTFYIEQKKKNISKL